MPSIFYLCVFWLESLGRLFWWSWRYLDILVRKLTLENAKGVPRSWWHQRAYWKSLILIVISDYKNDSSRRCIRIFLENFIANEIRSLASILQSLMRMSKNVTHLVQAVEHTNGMQVAEIQYDSLSLQLFRGQLWSYVVCNQIRLTGLQNRAQQESKWAYLANNAINAWGPCPF